jgi:hypothetical protein
MTCEEFTDLVELYAIGALEKTDAQAVQAHLEGGCGDCETRLDQALLQAALISAAVPLAEPPASLRDRITASVKAATPLVVIPQRKRSFALAPWLIAVAALIALIVGIGFEETARRADVAAISQANAERTAAMLAILQAPGTKQVSFDIDKANLPHGSLFIHKQLGVAMVVAHLPAAPAGWKYESWVVPKSGAPQPVESFDQNGYAFTVVKGPVDVTQWSAMAVSMEPQDATPVKPTKVVFASPV